MIFAVQMRSLIRTIITSAILQSRTPSRICNVAVAPHISYIIWQASAYLGIYNHTLAR